MERDLLLTKIGTRSLMTAITWGILIILIGCSNVPKETATGEYQERYEYDSKGKLTFKIAPDGSKTEYEYSDQGLLTKISYPKGSVSYGYDASGNRIWMQDPLGRIEYKYDAFDRLIEVVFKYSPEKRIRYGYDPWNRISSIEILENDRLDYQVKYEYNILGNLTSIDDGTGRIKYSYHPEKGEVVRYLPSGIKTVFSYLPLGELTSLKHLDSQNRLIASYLYEYSPPDKISRVIERTSRGIKTTRYEWNNRGYLKALHLPNGNTIRYEYDAMGNRVSMRDPKRTISYKYDNFGRLIKAGITKYEWDRNGNLISQIERRNKTRIRYNGRGLPALIRTSDATISYDWDGDGNMISRRMGKDITHYLPNPLAPPGFTLAEFDKAGRINTAYLYGDTLIGQRDRNGRIQYFLEDGFNSIRHISDIKGNIVGQHDYSPFGEPTLIKGNIDVDFRMAGERFFPEIKSYSIGGRLYEPNIGRYLSPDPLPAYMEKFDSFNKYAHGCKAPGIFMEPRCNQTKKVTVLGITQYGPQSSITPAGERFLQTSHLRYLDPNSTRGVLGFALKINEKMIGVIDLARATGNYLGAWFPPLANVGTNQEVWRGIISDSKNLEIIQGFSNGGITTYNLRGNIVRGIKDGLFPNLKEIRLPGIGLSQAMSNYLRKAGISNVRVVDNIWDPGVIKDPVRIITTPNVDRMGKTYANWGLNYVGAGISKAIEAGIGLLQGGGEYHKIPPDEGISNKAFSDPLKSIENQLGGIKLSSSAEFIGNLSNIAGAVYDPQRQCLVLVGEENVDLPSIKAEDLAVALACAFDPRYGDPQFSLDPYDPKNPRGKWFKAVYMPNEVIRGTPFGKTLFEADWLLKQYTFGVSIDKEGRKKERKSSVLGFKSIVDLTFERPDSKQGQESWARFWIVSDEMKLREYGNSIYFDVAKMRVKAKKQVPDPSSPTGLRDVESNDPIASAFADQFSILYDEISKESPEFGRVKELAKTVALAKWLKKENIPIDMDWVTKYVNKRIQTVDRIPALSEQWERRTETPFTRGNRSGIRTIIRQLHLFGGVDLTVKPKFVSGGRTAQNLQKEVVAALREKETGPVFGVTFEGKALRAVVLPITKSGQEMWRSRPTTDKDGNIYQLNDEGVITKSTDKFGNVSEYSYDAGQKLKTIKVTGKNGLEAFAEKDDHGSLWTITNSRGNTARYRYGKSGYLSEIELDGKKLASYNYDPDARVLDIYHQGYVEKVSYNDNGNVRDYKVRKVPGDTESVGEADRLTLVYDDSGNITRIEGPSVGHVDILYSEDKLPTAISRPREEARYVYDAKQRIKEVSFSSGLSASYTYDEEKLAKVEIKRGEKQAVYHFDDGRLVKVHNLLGGISEYGYTEEGLLNSVTDSKGNQGKYIYDEKSRLREIHFPDGRWIEYDYGQRKGHAKKPHPTPGQLITVTHHSSSSPLKRATREKSRSIEYKETVLNRRLEDDVRASKYLKNGLIIDLFAEPKGMTHANIVDSSGRVKEIDPDIAKKLRWLLNRTARTRGKLGRKLLDRWERFYSTHLKPLSKPAYWKSPDGKLVKQKAILIIKSNEVSYKYANLEKVPVLAENFVIFIASKPREEKGVAETSADELVTKIKNIPKLSKENVVFAIRPPRMKKEMQKEWEETITELERLVGRKNILFNPSKQEFTRMFNNRKNEIIVIELTHTDKGITLKGNERFNARDVILGGDLSHIKYLIAGLGTCSLPRLENGKLAAAFRKKGVGIMNGSFGSVSTEIALKRLKKLIDLFESLDEYDFPAYYLPDIIDQLIDVPRKEKGTTNLGKLIYHKRSSLG